LGLATPLAMTVAIGRGAKAGILVRSAEAMETLSRPGTVVFDKTGTLTQGRPRIVSALAVAPDGSSRVVDDVAAAPARLADEPFRTLLFHAASLETSSEHPLGRAFGQAAAAAGIAPVRPEAVEALVGRGITGTVQGTAVLVGNAALLRDRGIPLDTPPPASATMIHAALDGRYAGSFGLADPPRPEAAAVIADLMRRRLTMEMLSGDTPAAAHEAAAKVGITRATGGLAPQEKADRITAMKAGRADGTSVVFVGDGINDAPALAAAEVGIAMGSGADVALETADITLLSGGLAAVPRAIDLSQATMRTVRQNLALAFAYNLLALPVAAGLLYPLIGHVTSPMLAAAAMSLSSLSVIANSLRLRRLELD
jgi:Cu+-exporting ATPase